MKILVTGATGKVGAAFISQVLTRPEFSDGTVTALIHNRPITESDRVTAGLVFQSSSHLSWAPNDAYGSRLAG